MATLSPPALLKANFRDACRSSREVKEPSPTPSFRPERNFHTLNQRYLEGRFHPRPSSSPRMTLVRKATSYGTGVRRAECAALKLTDIDSARMVVHVQEGKGGKDRDIVLSPHLYQELRAHYRRLARKPAVWLFPGGRWHTADYPISDKVVWHACREAAQRMAAR